MKSILFSTLLFIGFTFTTQAQDISNHAIGLRLGDNSGFGGEISYQRGLSSNNRLEFDLGWRNRTNYNGHDDKAVKLSGLYQWVWNIDGEFNWYAGVGGGLGSYNNNVGNGAFVFAAGDIGIEYGLREIPLLISLDLRPEIGGSGYYNNNYGSDIALGLRYKF